MFLETLPLCRVYLYIYVSEILVEHNRMKFILTELMLGLALWFSTTDCQSMLVASE